MPHHTVMRSAILLGLAALVLLVGCSTTAESDPVTVRLASAEEAVRMLDERTVVDVRTPEEYEAGHIAGAINVPVEAADFGERISQLDRDTAYLLYCRSGRRSAMAADLMAAAGFSDIVDAGGLEDLTRAGAPVE